MSVILEMFFTLFLFLLNSLLYVEEATVDDYII